MANLSSFSQPGEGQFLGPRRVHVVGHGDETLAAQHRQHVVSPPAFGLRNVDLEPVVEAEESERALAVIDEPAVIVRRFAGIARSATSQGVR
jgi:hypothetical protein